MLKRNILWFCRINNNNNNCNILKLIISDHTNNSDKKERKRKKFTIQNPKLYILNEFNLPQIRNNDNKCIFYYYIINTSKT